MASNLCLVLKGLRENVASGEHFLKIRMKLAQISRSNTTVASFLCLVTSELCLIASDLCLLSMIAFWQLISILG